MREIRCRHCGAVFPSHHDGAVCPYCGSEPGSKFAGALGFLGRHWLAITAILLAAIFVRPSHGAWTWLTFVSIAAALGLAWFFLARAKRGKSPGEIETLDLGIERGIPRLGSPNVPLSPPKVPERWRALVDSRPPREVYLPPKVWKSFFVETFSVAFVVYGYYSAANRRHLSPLQFFYSRPDVGSLALVVPYFASVGARLKSFLTTRDMMREGEVAIAYTTNLSGRRATYQFWTKTGEIFERRTRVIKRPDVSADAGLVPVFYMPQDPRKSVALYGTEFSVRLPESASVPLQKAPAKV